MATEHTGEDWLVHDHRRYDQALDRAEAAAEDGDWKEALNLFRELLEDLRHHMALEDEVVYPLLEKETGDPYGEIAGLREEHANLERLLESAVTVVRNRDIDQLLDSMRPLHRALADHSAWEEEVLRRLGGTALTCDRERVERALAELRMAKDQGASAG